MPPSSGTGVARLVVDGLVVCVYNILAIALPELLAVNRLSKYYLSLPLLVLIVGTTVGLGLGQGSSLNPSAEAALLRLQEQFSLDDLLVQLENLCGPVIGAMAAGIVCLRFFPDDPRTWNRKRRT